MSAPGLGTRTASGAGAALVVVGALVLVGAPVAALVAGSAAAWGVTVGAVVVVVVFGFGMSITHAVAALSPALSLLVALMTYALQLVLLVVALLALERSGLLATTLDRGWVGGTIIVGTLVWSSALVRVAMHRTRYHSTEPGRHSSSSGGPEAGGGHRTAG